MKSGPFLDENNQRAYSPVHVVVIAQQMSVSDAYVVIQIDVTVDATFFVLENKFFQKWEKCIYWSQKTNTKNEFLLVGIFKFDNGHFGIDEF